MSPGEYNGYVIGSVARMVRRPFWKAPCRTRFHFTAVRSALDRVELNDSQTTMELAAHYLP